MANIRISQLPLATSPLGSTVEMPVVQGGVTRRAPVNTIGFLQSGAGAVARTVQDKLRDIVSQADYSTLSQAHDGAGTTKPVLDSTGLIWLGGARPANIDGNDTSGIFKGRVETTAGQNAGAGNGWQGMHLELYEGVNCIDGVNTSSKVDGFRVLHYLNKANATGGRHAAQFTFVQNSVTTAGNTDRNYVGAVGQVIVTVGDGGTGSGDHRGAYFGGNSYAASRGTSDWMANVTAHEFNTETRSGGRISYHAGIQIASYASQRGTNVDAAIAVGRLGTTNPLDGGSATQTWREVLCITNQNSATPVGSDTTVIKVDHTTTIARFADFRNVTFTGPVLETNNIQLTETSFVIASANSAIELGSKGASNTPFIDFNSSGGGFDYDARIIASGGGGSLGQGVITIQSGAVVLPSNLQLSAALIDAVDDAAAAAAGVGERRFYRTGSTVKIRVA